MVISEVEGWEKETGILLTDIIDEYFPSKQNELDFRIKEANRIPNCINRKRPSQRHILFKHSKITDKDSQDNQGKKTSKHKGNTIRLLLDFSVYTL